MSAGNVAYEHIFKGDVSAPKYQSRNPISRALVNGFLRSFSELAAKTGAKDVHEVGCGEGQLTGLLKRQGFDVRGSDFDEERLDVARSQTEAANLDIKYVRRSIYELDPAVDSASLIVCCEVLEHLDDPELALKKIASVSTGHVILSVPREPLWRILNMSRLKYLGAWGNTPGHLNHWSTRSFVETVSKYIDVEHVRQPTPWTMLSGRPRHLGRA